MRHAYDEVAAAYATTFGDELDQLPLDAELIDRIATDADGPILELGAGVAPLARRITFQYVVAADLSAQMLSYAPLTAGRVQADAMLLPFRDTVFGVATIRYVLQHIARADASAVVGEVRRVLRPGAWLLVAVHLGHGEIEFSELLGVRFEPIGGAFHSREEIETLLNASGFCVVEARDRGPVGDEGDSQRLYMLARATEH